MQVSARPYIYTRDYDTNVDLSHDKLTVVCLSVCLSVCMSRCVLWLNDTGKSVWTSEYEVLPQEQDFTTFNPYTDTVPSYYPPLEP